MITIQTPATSANVGPGFDCFGLALNLYNTFEVELSSSNCLENVEDRFNNEDNLFLKAYQKGCQSIGVNDSIHVIFHTEIPVSRGLGSSSSLIVGGLYAASALHNNALSKEQIFQLASELEGHPDNVAPCIYGGFTASLKTNDTFLTQLIPLDPSWKYTIFIPDFEVSTQKARSILPESYPRSIVTKSTSHAALLLEALRNGNLPLLKIVSEDFIHEPYRKELIHEFDTIKSYLQDSGAFLISGSGSTCILISKQQLTIEQKDKIQSLKHHWQIKELNIAEKGVLIS